MFYSGATLLPLSLNSHCPSDFRFFHLTPTPPNFRTLNFSLSLSLSLSYSLSCDLWILCLCLQLQVLPAIASASQYLLISYAVILSGTAVADFVWYLLLLSWFGIVAFKRNCENFQYIGEFCCAVILNLRQASLFMSKW
ncbi:hypothetical protein VNO77_16419 [Canavalia gladiata]|uniref:Uncharacterized protein n=1 Tax=Canavalia gladiata TaxID=3824 RepID=A0AAN9M5H2_CANGL